MGLVGLCSDGDVVTAGAGSWPWMSLLIMCRYNPKRPATRSLGVRSSTREVTAGDKLASSESLVSVISFEKTSAATQTWSANL